MQEVILNTNIATEEIMLNRLLLAAKEFYENPKNMQAFEAWLKNREAERNATNYVNA